MEAVRIALLLVAAALACAAMRAQRPELAAGVALAAGAAALTMLLPGLREAAAALSLFSSASGLDGGAALILDEFRAGRMGRITLERAPTEKEDGNGDQAGD